MVLESNSKPLLDASDNEAVESRVGVVREEALPDLCVQW